MDIAKQTTEISPNTTTDSGLSFEKLRSDERIVLERSSGLAFKNDVITARTDGKTLKLYTTGEQTNFGDMAKARTNPDNMQRDEADIAQLMTDGLSLSNIGVSTLVRTHINGDDYILLARRPNGMLMMPSGYVDSNKNDAELSRVVLDASNGLKELNEEILPARSFPHDGEVKIELKTLLTQSAHETMREIILGNSSSVSMEAHNILRIDLGFPYSPQDEAGVTKLNYTNGDPVIVRPADSIRALPGINFDQSVTLDDASVEIGKFVFIKETSSGQFIYPYDINLGSIENLSLFHAETCPDKEGGPGALLEVLDRKGLILGKLDKSTGFLNGETFYLADGQLLATGFEKESLFFAELFSTKLQQINSDGCVLPVTTPGVDDEGKTITTVSFADYLKSCELNSLS